MADLRADLIAQAGFAEQAERYDDMKDFMKDIVDKGGATVKLSTQERNLLSVAYKNVVGSRRSAWRVISSIEIKSKDSGDKVKEDQCLVYRKTIEKELQGICHEVLGLLKDLSINSSTPEETVFYLKMKGDYHRYLAEVASEDRQNVIESSELAYKEAMDKAMELESTNPIRLGLALNFSVFYYEIANQHDKACDLSKKAFDDAISTFDTVNGGNYKDSTLILQLLRDNLTLWTTEPEQEDEQ